MILYRNLIFIYCLFLSRTQAQTQILQNEKLIYSFQTTSKKTLSLSRDSNDTYLLYRFGKVGKVEFEYPTLKNKSSWKKFEYSTYFRGGGADNIGMDVNYIMFENKNFRYIIYDTFYAENKSQSVGIKVINLKTMKTSNISGLPATIEGSLTFFRDNDEIKKSEKLYD